MSKIKILVLPSDRTGVGKFRSIEPHIFLQNKYPEDFHIDIDFEPKMDDISYWTKYDMVCFHRSLNGDYDKSNTLIQVLNSLGIITVMDLDDYWLPTKEHPAYHLVIQHKIHEKILANIKVAKYVTTTTSITSTLGMSGFSDENYGYGYGSESGNKCHFATDVFETRATSWSASGQQKGISSKVGKGYCGNEGTYQGGYNLRRWDAFTETNIGNVAKPRGNCGEENFAMGQDWQYMLGCYGSSLQNNDSWKMYYQTDTGVLNPAGLPPAVNAGTSSGHCAWRE